MPLESRTTYLPFGRPSFSEAEIEAVTRVMRSGWIGMGPETLAFEEELAATIGTPHVVTVNSCTSALFLSLLVNGVGPGDEVICPSLTWCSTANAALYLGAKPVFGDIDPHTLCLSPAAIRPLLTPRTKAVVVVHFGGQTADIAGLRTMLPPGVALVEDAAHAFGAKYADGRAVGGSGNATCFSFYANKNLATGEGGAVAVADRAFADHLRSLRQHALPIDAWKRFTHASTVLLSPQLTELGYKANYTDLQAAIGRVQLRRFPELAEIRAQLVNRYLRRLSPLADFVKPYQDVASGAHARHLLTIEISEKSSLPRDQLLAELRRRNIGATIHYAPLHQMPLYQSGPDLQLPVTEAIARRILTLPISASMGPDDVDYVCDHLAALVV